MSDNNSFRDMLDNWVDKAGELLDNLKNDDNGYMERLRDATNRLDSAARASKQDVHQGVREAGKELKERSREITERLDNWIEGIQEHAKHAGDISQEQLDRFKEKADRIKEEIKQDTDHMQDEIKGRSYRFDQGIDRILKDLRTNNSAEGRNVTGTSPIDHEGDYNAADFGGTINNYDERLRVHTASTKERIRDRVDQAEDSFRDKVEDLTGKYQK